MRISPLFAADPSGGWRCGSDLSPAVAEPVRVMLAFRLARRELRGGVRGLWIVLLCLALGLRSSPRSARCGRRPTAGWPPTAAASSAAIWRSRAVRSRCPMRCATGCAARGATLSDVVQMRSMLVAPSGQRQLVELKAVDAAWPLVGAGGRRQPRPQPPSPARGSGGRREHWQDHGLLAERVVLDRLGLHPGDTVRLGNASFTVRGALIAEPDRVAAPLILGPRVLISAAALPSTGLIAPGSMVQYAIRATLPDPAAALPCRQPARGVPRPGLAHPRPARRRARRHPLHRPDQPVHDPGRPDLAAGRRHRRRQRRARLAGRARPDHRHAALSRRLVRGWSSRSA